MTAVSARRIIFLDFDGVIVTAHDRYTNGDQYCVFQLNRITDSTEAKIVVSSSWRIGRTVEELRELLKLWGVTAECIDKTPRNWGKSRGDEIQEWLDKNPVDSFVILDDDSDMVHLHNSLVKCHHIHGLDDDQVDQAIEILQPVAAEAKP
jgi:hypothetical protein